MSFVERGDFPSPDTGVGRRWSWSSVFSCVSRWFERAIMEEDSTRSGWHQQPSRCATSGLSLQEADLDLLLGRSRSDQGHWSSMRIWRSVSGNQAFWIELEERGFHSDLKSLSPFINFEISKLPNQLP